MSSVIDNSGEILAVLVKELAEMKLKLPAQVPADMPFYPDMGMDSLTRVEYIARVEQAFRLQVPDDEWQSLTCLASVTEYIQQHQSM
ncbi:MAG: hypothetical protein KZQ73_04375 [Candidatus Thiodiazotropha sp. (ex Semelilucina semeliformis)]|nr:hypothetical protein [Candidatus Thiodiazotropha sp. (ex Semelilucina semeliformis)]MCU7830810.1 hypothetical protein [Candidatus Thiodiazotropha sp. (ex Myrtea sp. 'scaly one' KF741663)]